MEAAALVGKEFQQLRGVGRQVATLRDELATMNAILRMHSEADDGSVDHFVREWMKQIRELASDGEDCVDLYVFRMRRRASDGFVHRLKRLSETLFRRRRLAGQIQELRDRAVAISDRHARYGVGRDALGRTTSLNPEPALRASVRSFHRPANQPYQLVGMDEQADALIERMMKGIDDIDGDKQLKVFSIVGFGGLGKTTLAMEVCRRLETMFQRQANVSVSQTFEGNKNLQSLLKRILQQIVKAKSDNDKGIKEELTVGDIDTMSVQQLESTLKNTLADKRYLIVIDDVWAIAAWDLIRSKLPDNNCGSRIIVTTRIQAVAKACCVSEDYIHPIQPLNPQDSEKLFASRAFGSMNARCPEGLETEMREILKKCGGLPLAIVSLGSLLESYSSSGSKHMWERICRSIGSQMESNPTLNGMRQILTLSYNHLPYYLKGCMMYLSNFPEDYVIEQDRLLNRWIAEGLVPQMRGLTLLEVAEACFEELMSRNMIDRGTDIFNFYDGRVETCRVHDMMLEVMVTKSLEVNFVSLIGGQYEGMSYDIDRVRRLSIHGVEEDSQTKKKTAAVHGSKRSGTEDMNVQHVRSLSLFEVPTHKLLYRLGEFELLRVLDMEGCAVKTKHLGNICRMYLLRFLNLKSTDITSMPAEIGELEHLQTLDVRSTLLQGLPDTVVNLEKLERLLFSNRSTGDIRWMMPRGVKKMKALREVSKVVMSPDIKVAKEIGELDQLEKLGMYVNSNNSIGREVLEAFAISLSNIHSLRWLNIGDIGYTPYILNFLHLLPSPPRLLRYLRIAAQLDRLPGWVGTLTNLVEFTMSWGHLVDNQLYEVLCKLPNLESIFMEGHCYTGEALVARTDYKFPVLRNLTAFPGCEFPGVYKFEEGSMTMVETLSVSFHKGFDRKIYGVEHLPNLKEVQLYGEKESSALRTALEEFSKASKSREKSKQFKVAVKYD